MNKDRILSIPSLDRRPEWDWKSVRQRMKTGLRLSLCQNWRINTESELAPGYVRLACLGDYLFLYARLHDKEPRNSSTRWNEHAWKLGDVIELFLRADSCQEYHEFHVTPENQRLQLRFPDAGSVRRPDVPLEHWTVGESLFESAARVSHTQTEWEVFLSVNLAALFNRDCGDWQPQGGRFHFLIGRYDYQPGRDLPVLSSTAPLTVLNFHRLQEWSAACFQT